MEIIILTSIICTLFITFIFGPLLYAHKQVEKKSKKTITNVKKIKKIVRTISDMESDGIYFSQEVKDELREKYIKENQDRFVSDWLNKNVKKNYNIQIFEFYDF